MIYLIFLNVCKNRKYFLEMFVHEINKYASMSIVWLLKIEYTLLVCMRETFLSIPISQIRNHNVWQSYQIFF